MPKKLIALFSVLLLAAVFISGCGKEDVKADKKTEAAEKEDQTKNEDQTKEKEQETEKEAAAEEDASADTEKENTATNDVSGLISFMEEQTEGTTKTVFENSDKQTHDLKDISVSLDAYTVVQLNDFHTDFSIPFNDQTDGGVILAKYSVENKGDKDAYYMPSLDGTFTGATKAYTNYKELIPEEDQLSTVLSPANDYVVKAGETAEGYFAYPFGKDAFDKIMDLGTIQVDVPPAQGTKGKFDNPIGSKGKFTISLNDKGAEKASANAKFYQDDATKNDMGEKKLLKEKSDIGKKEKLRDVTVTLDGYQFAEFTPNEVEAPRFKNFKNGVVILTVKFLLDNKGKEDIGLSGISSTLRVNDGSQWMINEGMLKMYTINDLIEANDSGELLQVYVLDKEQYDKIWKDKDFDIEIGPMRNKEAKDISKGKKASFKLPNE
ncbi:DUF5068 domain-containing protein [Virgibacillus halophilus]|uniref:DUF5068 domain-containing protein n=1 Tax=Tigheibacillus halophilus TaxID=361280 RepID=UPI00362E0140